MRIRYVVSLAIVLCLGGMLVYGQSAKRTSGRSRKAARNTPVLSAPPDSISVDISLARPPVYITDTRKSRIGSSNTPDAFKYWLVNEITFGLSYRPGKKAGPLLLENLKVELYIYASGPARDGAGFRWFCGVQTLQSVVVEPDPHQRKYMASLFLPANYVFLHFPQERGRNDLRALSGVVVIADKDNNILGRKAFGYRNKLPPGRPQILMKASDELRGKKTKNQVPLWPREKTPWSWLDADRFEVPAIFDPSGENKAGAAAKQPVQPAAGNEEKENEE